MTGSAPVDEQNPAVSVVIGFKDWGLERMELSVRSIHDSLESIPHEVIIADYGSEDPDAVAESAHRVGARHEAITTDGEWSRSRALNAGVRAASSDLLLATDADMLFSPRALSRVVEQLDQHPQEIVLLQCRDLPIGYSHDEVARRGFDWEHFATIGQLRPRWGMGGLVGVQRSVWSRLRGWDERMHTYGGEDIDFGKRARMYGARIDWLDEPGVAMYHVWHPSSATGASRSPEAAAAIENNRRIHMTEKTFARNRVHSRYLPEQIAPLVSVVVDAGRSAETAVRATVASVLGQSINDVEVTLLNSRLEGLEGPRIRLSAAETPEINGTFTTVAQAGEIWADDRLERLLGAWTPGVGLLSDRSAVRLVDQHGHEILPAEVLPARTPDARATMIRTSLLPLGAELSNSGWPRAVQSVGASGASWVVTAAAAHVVVATPTTDEELRAVRESQSIVLATTLERCGLGLPEIPDGELYDLGVRANALLRHQQLLLVVEAPATVDLDSALVLSDRSHPWDRRSVATRNGATLGCTLQWSGHDLLYAARAEQELRALGATVTVKTAAGAEASALLSSLSPLELVQHAETIYGSPATPHAWVVAECAGEASDELGAVLRSTPSVTVVLDRVLQQAAGSTSYVLARYRSAHLASALDFAASLRTPASVQVIEPHVHSEEATR